MNSFAKLAVATVVVAAIGAIGLSLVRPGSTQVGGSPDLHTPIPIASQPAGAGPSHSALPAITESFTSTINGYSISYPFGWRVTPAIEPWTSGLPTQCGEVCDDRLSGRGADSPLLAVASQPLGGQSGEAWAARILGEPAWGTSCSRQTAAITIDRAPGMIARSCSWPMLTALGWAEDRGYLFTLYRIDDVAWFRKVLASVNLEPSAKHAVPTASP